MPQEKIVSIEIIDSHKTLCVTESGIKFEQWHMEDDYPQVGEVVDTDKFLSPFTPASYDLRTREHRSPFY